MSQLSFNLGDTQLSSFDNWRVIEANTDVYALLSSGGWLQQAITLIYGASGVGKSHLLHACCLDLQQRGGKPSYLNLGLMIQAGPTALQGLRFDQAIVIDELDAVVGNHHWELGLYHLINHARTQSCPLLLASKQHPDKLSWQLPDLASRLTWGGVFELQALAADQANEEFCRRAEAQGLVVSKEAAAYIAHHYPRDTGSLMQLLKLLGSQSLLQQRRITQPFVKEVLAQMEAQAPKDLQAQLKIQLQLKI